MTRFAFTRTRAVLAGGTILGLGAVATFAAWSDSEWASASFRAQAATFAVEGSTSDGANWASHTSPDMALTLFNTEADNATISSGDTAFSTYMLRIKEDSTVNTATAVLAEPTGTPSNLINYTVRAGSCNTGTVMATFNKGVWASQAGNSLTLQKGTVQDVCFEATLADTPENTANQNPENTSDELTWHFTITEGQA